MDYDSLVVRSVNDILSFSVQPIADSDFAEVAYKNGEFIISLRPLGR